MDDPAVAAAAADIARDAPRVAARICDVLATEGIPTWSGVAGLALVVAGIVRECGADGVDEDAQIAGFVKLVRAHLQHWRDTGGDGDGL
jgi:hypothetical protein